MRVWISAFLFLVAGAFLVAVGSVQLRAAWPHAPQTIAGDVVSVDTHIAPAGLGRNVNYVIALKERAERFALPSLMLPHPTAGQLIDAATVSITYDPQARLNADAEGGVVYAVNGLAADGHVYFTPNGYALAVAVSSLIVLGPGVAMFIIGAVWLYRLRANPSWRPARVRFKSSRSYAPVLALAGPVHRDPRKTADGEWLH